MVQGRSASGGWPLSVWRTTAGWRSTAGSWPGIVEWWPLTAVGGRFWQLCDGPHHSMHRHSAFLTAVVRPHRHAAPPPRPRRCPVPCRAPRLAVFRPRKFLRSGGAAILDVLPGAAGVRTAGSGGALPEEGRRPSPGRSPPPAPPPLPGPLPCARPWVPAGPHRPTHTQTQSPPPPPRSSVDMVHLSGPSSEPRFCTSAPVNRANEVLNPHPPLYRTPLLLISVRNFLGVGVFGGGGVRSI